MLQCAGCGEPVSEYAARCPVCKRSVEDAIEIPAPVSEQAKGAETAALPEPTDDREPDETTVRSRSHRYGRATGVVAVLAFAVAVTAVVWASSSGSSRPGPLNGLVGRVLIESQTGAVSWVNPANGNGEAQLLDRGRRLTPIAVSPEGTTLLDSSGAEVTLQGERLVDRPTAVGRMLSNATLLAQPSAFADDDQAVVLLNRRTPGSGAVATLVSLRDGHQVSLGIVDSAAGDPQDRGAFVSVPSRPFRAQTADAAFSDVAVELLAAGGSPTTLITAQQVDQDVGWLPSTPVRLGVYPDPTGSSVAVVVNPLSPTTGDVPIVILTRQGGLLAALSDQAGPMYATRPSWSPGGHQLAYPTYNKTGIALAIGTETGTFERLPAPPSTNTIGPCIWSPDSTDVLCQSRLARHHRWLYALSNLNHLISGTSPGDPVAWVIPPLGP